jgi:hypothetical protein
MRPTEPALQQGRLSSYNGKHVIEKLRPYIVSQPMYMPVDFLPWMTIEKHDVMTTSAKATRSQLFAMNNVVEEHIQKSIPDIGEPTLHAQIAPT